MPGSGKSNCAEKLASLAQGFVINTDKIIESIEGESITEIFSNSGEKRFRDLESKIISFLSSKMLTASSPFKNNQETYSKIEQELLPLLKKASSTPGKLLILDVGGGLPVHNNLMAELKALGLVVFLSCKPETLLERLKNDSSRPLLNLKDDEIAPIKEKFEKMVKLLRERQNCYRDAHITVNTELLNPDEVAKKIVSEIKNWKSSEDFSKTV